MFSAEYYQQIKTAFDRQMALIDDRIRVLEQAGKEGGINRLSGRLLSEKKEEIYSILNRCTEEEAQALTFLYSAMPFSDLQDYPASLFLSYAKHGVFLWNQGSFAGRVPENLFANYVLHYRVNNEDITDTRGFFYDHIKEAVDLSAAGSGQMYDTAIDINYWCAREATYRSTDGRTQNPRTMFGTTTGRCGEESTFAVTALRSIGIPARQIYAPLWTHCDDNHAWVELWCDGKWYFLGACEPEEEMNRGWFIGPASRGVMLHSRWFGKDAPQDRQVGPKGMAKVLNHLDRYAVVTGLKVRVEDEDGCPVSGAKVDFQVVNHGGFGTVAIVYTGSEGEDRGIARLVTGLGDLYMSVSARKEETGEILYGENRVSLWGQEAGKEAECLVVLKKKPECTEGWKEMDFQAPEPGHMHEGDLTPQQCKTGEKRLAWAAEYRQNKAGSFYNEREASRVLGRFDAGDRAEIEKILRMSHSNINEIIRFIEWNPESLITQDSEDTRNEHWKVEVLKSLREKDYWDIRAEVLTDCCTNALSWGQSDTIKYAENCAACGNTIPSDIFYRYLVCPRVSLEMLRPCRTALKGYWDAYADDGVKADFKRNPGCLPELVEGWILSMPEQEYEDLITSPTGCLRGGVGSRHSREVFCVNLYRALGIPARLRGLDGRLEYWRNGRFQAAGKEQADSCILTLLGEGGLKLNDWEHYSVECFEEEGFCRLGLWETLSASEGDKLELHVKPGIYRILTTNRNKNGGQMVKVAVFTLEEGEKKEMHLSMRTVPVEDLLTRIRVKDFALRTMEGESRMLSDLGESGKALVLWLGVTREPTEHILNELYDMRQEYAALEAPVYAVLKSPEDLEDKTLKRTLEVLPGIRILLDDFGENYQELAGAVGQEPGKLPLAVILNGQQECIYSDAGYNVGLADMLYKILN